MILLLTALALTVLMCIIARMLRLNLSPALYRRILLLLIPAYLLVNFSMTLFTRTPGDYPVVFVPFRAILRVFGWDVRTFESLGKLLSGQWDGGVSPDATSLVGVLQNIVLFLPFGFLLSGLQKMKTWQIILLGFALSLMIECTQLGLRIGWFEVDDLIDNTLGTWVGIAVYRRTVEKA